MFHYHGCDIRPRAMMLTRHPISACTECRPYCSPPRQHRLRRSAARHGSLEIVSTPDLLEVVPEAVHLPVAVDTEAWQRRRAAARPAPGFVVLHAPSDPLIKGTRHVEAAVARLAARLGDVSLLKIAGMPAAAAVEEFGRATVAVDQLHMGWHGLFAVEAMMLGKPVLAYIRPELRSYRPALPVVPTDRERLGEDLARLHDQPAERRRLAAAGVEYAAAEHGLAPVAASLKRLYEERVLGERTA